MICLEMVLKSFLGFIKQQAGQRGMKACQPLVVVVDIIHGDSIVANLEGSLPELGPSWFRFCCMKIPGAVFWVSAKRRWAVSTSHWLPGKSQLLLTSSVITAVPSYFPVTLSSSYSQIFLNGVYRSCMMCRVYHGGMFVGDPEQGHFLGNGVLEPFNKGALEYVLVLHSLATQGLDQLKLCLLYRSLVWRLSEPHDPRIYLSYKVIGSTCSKKVFR